MRNKRTNSPSWPHSIGGGVLPRVFSPLLLLLLLLLREEEKTITRRRERIPIEAASGNDHRALPLLLLLLGATMS